LSGEERFHGRLGGFVIGKENGGCIERRERPEKRKTRPKRDSNRLTQGAASTKKGVDRRQKSVETPHPPKKKSRIERVIFNRGPVLRGETKPTQARPSKKTGAAVRPEKAFCYHVGRGKKKYLCHPKGCSITGPRIRKTAGAAEIE